MPKKGVKIKAQSQGEISTEIQAKMQKEKQLIMYSGVTFFMMLFIGLWFASFTSAVKDSVDNSDKSDSLTEVLDKFRSDLDETRASLEAAKSQTTDLLVSTTTEAASTSSQELNIDNLNFEIENPNIEKLKKDLEGQVNSTTSSQSGLPKSQ